MKIENIKKCLHLINELDKKEEELEAKHFEFKEVKKAQFIMLSSGNSFVSSKRYTVGQSPSVKEELLFLINKEIVELESEKDMIIMHIEVLE